MNLLGLTGLAAGTILTRHIVSGQKTSQAIQNQNNANLQNELLLFATGNSRALSSYQIPCQREGKGVKKFDTP